MLKKISLLATAVAFVVAINALSLQDGNNRSNGSFIQSAKAESYNHRKDCFLREGCKFKIDHNCAGSNCKKEPPPSS